MSTTLSFCNVRHLLCGRTSPFYRGIPATPITTDYFTTGSLRGSPAAEYIFARYTGRVHGLEARVAAYAIEMASVAASPLATAKARPAHTPPAARVDAASPTTPAPRRDGAPECKVGPGRIQLSNTPRRVCA